MTKFTCPRCHLNTHIRTHFKRHLTRKNVCKPVYKDVPVKSIAETYGIDISSTENIGVIRKVIRISKSGPLSGPDNNLYEIYYCRYCNKSFKHKSNKSRHEKSRCAKRNYNNIITTNNNVTYTQEDFEREVNKKAEKKIKEVQKEAEEKAEVIADKKAQKMVLSLIDKLIPNKTTNSHNTITQNNNTQNNNTQNNNQQVKINNFGKENTNYITDARLKIMFVDPRNTVIQHIKDTHYHLLHPENYNAKITNHKSKHMKVYEDNEWITVNKKATICSMYNRHEKIMNREFERLKPELTKQVRDKYSEYTDTAHSCYHTYNQRLIDTEAAIITGTQRQKNIDLLRKEEVLRLAKEQNKTPSEIFAEHMPDIFADREDISD